MERKDINTLRQLFDYAVKNYADNKALYYVSGEGYTYHEFGDKVNQISDTLSVYGIEKGEKVGLLSQNMPNWAVAFFSTVNMGQVIVPMLPDFSESDIKHILKHSESKALFISKRLLPKLHEKALGRLSLVIIIDDFSIYKGTKIREKAIRTPSEDIKAEDLANIIYTSGTTGSSKGVMLSNKNLCANLHTCEIMRPSFEWDIWLSILPLSHTLENSQGLLLPIISGGSVYYLEKMPTPSILMKAISTVKPTTILAVPLIIEKIYKNAIEPTLNKNFISRSLLKIPFFRHKLHRIAGKKLQAKFGKQLRFFGLGGAKLNEKVERFLYEAKFPYAVGYGLTETSPLLAGINVGKTKLFSTGPAVSGVELKLINKDPETGIGEIVAKGDNIMMGYYKNEEATEATFTEDGWFRTKDLGLFDSDGYLYIKGRTNNTIIGPSGENIYPEEIESIINSHFLVSESLVKEEKGRLTALIHFNQEKIQAFLSAKDDLKNSAQEKMDNLKKDILDYVNQKVSRFSKISEINEQENEFEKTATQKIKRFLYTKLDSATKKAAEKAAEKEIENLSKK